MIVPGILIFRNKDHLQPMETPGGLWVISWQTTIVSSLGILAIRLLATITVSSRGILQKSLDNFSAVSSLGILIR